MTEAPPDSGPGRGTGTWIVVCVLLLITIAIGAFLILPSRGDDGATRRPPRPTLTPYPCRPAPRRAQATMTEAAPSTAQSTSAEETTALPTVPPPEHPPRTTYLDGGAAFLYPKLKRPLRKRRKRGSGPHRATRSRTT